jgi:two-component system phosphate regulon sensor histidine kinase PhoR
MRLRHKILLAYALIFGLWAAGLGLYMRSVVASHVTAQQRDALLPEARMARASILAPGVAISAGALQPRAAAVAALAGLRVTVIAADGVVLADTEADPTKMENHGLRPEIVQARREGWGWAVRRSPTLGVDMLYVAVAQGGEPTVRLARPLSGVRHLNADLFDALLVGLVLAGVAGSLAGLRISEGLAASMAHLARVARAIGAGDLSARAAVRSGDEAGDLATAINAMAEGLERTGAELAGSTAQVRAILHHMTDGLLLVGADGLVALVNPAAARMLAADAAAATSHDLSYLAGGYELAETVRRALDLGTVTEVEFTAPGAEERRLQAAAAPVEVEDGRRGAVVVLRDVTRVRRLEQVRRDFIANAGHELRTPVAAVRSLAEALAAGALADPQAGPAFLDQIVGNTERMAQLVDDMMELARLEVVEHPLESVDVGAVVARAVEHLRPQAEAREVTVTAEVPEGTFALGNADSLETVVANLVDNALKYAAEGRAVEVTARHEGDEVLIAVADHGPGIPAAERARIFERFYRLDRARSRELGGTGLGLSIVKHAVEAMGGAVSVEETPGGGATFVVTLRAAAPLPAATGPAPSPDSPSIIPDP